MPSRIPLEWMALDVVEFLRANRVPIDPAAPHICNHEGQPVDGRLLLQDGPDLLLAWVGKYDPETRAAVKAATQLATVLFVFFEFPSRVRCHPARHSTLFFFPPPNFSLPFYAGAPPATLVRNQHTQPTHTHSLRVHPCVVWPSVCCVCCVSCVCCLCRRCCACAGIGTGGREP
jgi:hypothetical protein